MTEIFGALVGILIFLVIPILMIILLIRILAKKSIKKVVIATITCAGLVFNFTIAGVLTYPATWCEHEYMIIEEIEPTCTQKGKVVKECSLCEMEITNYPKKVAHSWEKDSVINATCTNGGYTIEKCSGCAKTHKTDETDALGHSIIEYSRIEPTPALEGEVVHKCERCDYEKKEVLEKIEETVSTDEDEDKKSSFSWICKHEEIGKIFSFVGENKTSLSYIQPYCRGCDGTYGEGRYGYYVRVTRPFQGTPNDLSYLDAIREHSDGGEMVGGEYYTMTATVSVEYYSVYGQEKISIRCKVEYEGTIVFFSVEFRDEYKDEIVLLEGGDEITFRGGFYDNGCGFTDCELIK